MNHANPKMENSAKSVYDRIRRPFNELQLNMAATQ